MNILRNYNMYKIKTMNIKNKKIKKKQNRLRNIIRDNKNTSKKKEDKKNKNKMKKYNSNNMGLNKKFKMRFNLMTIIEM